MGGLQDHWNQGSFQGGHNFDLSPALLSTLIKAICTPPGFSTVDERVECGGDKAVEERNHIVLLWAMIGTRCHVYEHHDTIKESHYGE